MTIGTECRLSASAFSPPWSKASFRGQTRYPSAPAIVHDPENVSDEAIDFQQVEKTNVLEYINGLPDDIRRNISDYLMRGDADVLKLTVENFHHYFHIATFLPDQSLSNACLSFLKSTKSRRQKIVLPGMCECCLEALLANRIGAMSRSNSIMPTAEDKATFPEYAILFLKTNDEHSKGKVMIINMENRYEILQPKVSKVNKFGEGFASCSAQIDDSPYVFISGGNGKTSNAMCKYDVILNEWNECAKLKFAHSKHVMASVNSNVYIIGGRECDSVEMYTPANNTITTVANLQVAVHSAAFVVYGHNIYIFGGKSKRGPVNRVQCIDTNTNKVISLNDLPCECSGGQAVVSNDKVFYATGQGHMIKFDPSTGRSELCAQQPFRRKLFAIFENNSTVFLFGGVRTDGPLDQECTMSKYCPKKDMWVKEVMSFKKPLPIYTSCTVKYAQKCPVVPFMELYGLNRR